MATSPSLTLHYQELISADTDITSSDGILVATYRFDDGDDTQDLFESASFDRSDTFGLLFGDHGATITLKRNTDQPEYIEVYVSWDDSHSADSDTEDGADDYGDGADDYTGWQDDITINADGDFDISLGTLTVNYRSGTGTASVQTDLKLLVDDELVKAQVDDGGGHFFRFFYGDHYFDSEIYHRHEEYNEHNEHNDYGAVVVPANTDSDVVLRTFDVKDTSGSGLEVDVIVTIYDEFGNEVYSSEGGDSDLFVLGLADDQSGAADGYSVYSLILKDGADLEEYERLFVAIFAQDSEGVLYEDYFSLAVDEGEHREDLSSHLAISSTAEGVTARRSIVDVSLDSLTAGTNLLSFDLTNFPATNGGWDVFEKTDGRQSVDPSAYDESSLFTVEDGNLKLISDIASDSGVYYLWVSYSYYDEQGLYREAYSALAIFVGDDVRVDSDGKRHMGDGSDFHMLEYDSDDGDDIDYGNGDDFVISLRDGSHSRLGGDKDTYFGNARQVTVDGEDGDDTIVMFLGEGTLSGGSGDDFIVGGVGNDTIDGGTGDDVLVGDMQDLPFFGNDLIEGGAGNDVLMGGDGEDTFVFAHDGSEDLIAGFNPYDVWLYMNSEDVTASAAVQAMVLAGDLDLAADFNLEKDRLDLSAFGFANREDALSYFDTYEGGIIFDYSADGLQTEIKLYGLTDLAAFTESVLITV